MSEERDSGSTLTATSATAWIGIISTIVSLGLTVFNTRTKMAIDDAESKLKNRAETVEESREKVARYSWVRTLFPDLQDPDPQKRTFTLALIRLALDKQEAEQLFSGLSESSNKDLQQAGQTGLANLQTEASNPVVAQLIAQLNADTPEARKAAVASLISRYKGSTFAISAVLQLLSSPTAGNLSPSTTIDGLYFLGASDPTVWSDAQIALARQSITRIQATNPGPQTQAAISSLTAFLEKAAHSK